MAGSIRRWEASDWECLEPFTLLQVPLYLDFETLYLNLKILRILAILSKSCHMGNVWNVAKRRSHGAEVDSGSDGEGAKVLGAHVVKASKGTYPGST